MNTTTQPTELLSEGKAISILVSGAVTYNAVAVRMAHGTVESFTEKAIKVRFDNGQSIWFPKSQLKAKGSSFEMSAWLKKNMNDAQWNILDRVSEVNGVAA